MSQKAVRADTHAIRLIYDTMARVPMYAPYVMVFGAMMVLFAGCAAYAEQPAERVTYVEYSDDTVALADVGAGRLDIYYHGLSPEILDAVQGVNVYESQSGSYSLLVNPAISEELNVFAEQKARYALNHIIDRSIIVNELLGGHGVEMHSAYAPYDPDYAALVMRGVPEFAYDPDLAHTLIADSLVQRGAVLEDGIWMHDDKSVEVRIFIRSDDLIRKALGEILALELESTGLVVHKEYGDLNKAFAIVYGTDPAELRWSVYTEGWGGKSAFVRYDPVILAQMYAPWFSAMPGFNDPTYWNYENGELDALTRDIYAGGFASSTERDEIIHTATVSGVREAVRVFLAARSDLYAANPNLSGIVNDFGAGVPSRFTVINARTDSAEIRIGVKQIYQGAWNPVMGFSDTYSSRIWATITDPAVFRDPYNGSPVPVRASWDVHTEGPHGSIDVPRSAMLWDAETQSWQHATEQSTATSVVTFDLALSEWHHGESMDINDIMYAVYFVSEWGSDVTPETFDAEYASRAAQVISTIQGVEIIDADTVRVYVDYWHFDEAEIADWASVWAPVPWEVYAGMERTVSEGAASFSRSGAGASGVPWLSLAIMSDAQLVGDRIADMYESGHVPKPLAHLGADVQYVAQRYAATLDWIDTYGHAVISNGPFYLERYSPESRTISTASFEDESYPFTRSHWRGLESVELPSITGVQLPLAADSREPLVIPIDTSGASDLHYFVSSDGMPPEISGTLDVSEGRAEIVIQGQQLGTGTHTLYLYALSQDVLRPDIFSKSFISAPHAVSPAALNSTHTDAQDTQWSADILVIVVAIIAIAALALVRYRTILFR